MTSPEEVPNGVEMLRSRVHVVRQRGHLYDAQCPSHDDHRASLVFGPGENGGTVLHCHAGCRTEAIVTAIGMRMADLSPEPHIVATYQYRDEQGQPLYQVQRWEPKDFRSVGMPPKGQRVLYHSELLPQARARSLIVHVCEGEKDCDNLVALGEIAVCGAGGAGSWLPHYARQLDQLDVVVIADNDDPGRSHARAVVRSLDEVAKSVSLVQPSYGKDISDQLAAGYDLDTLIPLSMEETLEVLRADMVRERPVSWLWPGYLPAGKLILIEGDPGDGKSVMTCDLAARLSTGAPLPDGTRTPATDVIMISAEDDPEDTIRPRLRVAGADLRRIHLVVGGAIEGSSFDLGRDLPALELLVTSTGARVVFIDPLMAFLPGGIDSYKDHDVRRVLTPLSRMAARTQASIVVVRHLVKGSGRSKAITAGGGSIGFIGASRAGYLVAPHPDDDTKRVLGCVKINIGPKPPALGYRVMSSGGDSDPPLVRWDDAPLEMSAQDLLDGTDASEARDAQDAAEDFLIEQLSANHSGMTWPDIVKAGKREDHSEATLRRIRHRVARLVRNPMNSVGEKRKGAFWLLKTLDERATDSPAPHPEPAVVVDRVDPPEPSPDGPCDVCGGEPAVTFDDSDGPVRRCLAHNPFTYKG